MIRVIQNFDLPARIRPDRFVRNTGWLPWPLLSRLLVSLLFLGCRTFSLEDGADAELYPEYHPETSYYQVRELPITLPEARHRHVAGRLADGRVAVLGGFSAHRSGFLISADLTHVDPLSIEPVWRGGDISGVTLPNGDLLVVRGGPGVIFARETLKTRYTENALQAPEYLRWVTLTPLRNGQVLASGGFNGSFEPLTQWALYDPERNRFVAFGELSTPRGHHSATELADGRILIAGGHVRQSRPGGHMKTAEILDLRTGKSSPLAAEMQFGRSRHAAVIMNNDQVLLVGGGERRNEIFDPETMTFRETAALGRVRSAPLLWKHGDEILVIGGEKNGRVIEIFDMEQEVVRINPELMRHARGTGFTVTPHTAHSVLVVGGRVNDTALVLDAIEEITFRRPPLRAGTGIPAEAWAGENDVDAVVTVYDGEEVHAQFAITKFAVTRRELWGHQRNHAISEMLDEHLPEEGAPRLRVAFSPGADHQKRVTLLFILSSAEIPVITVEEDLSPELMETWQSPPVPPPVESDGNILLVGK